VNWLPGTRTVTVDVFGTPLAVHRADPPGRPSRPPVLLLHGLPQTSAAFRFLVPPLAADRVVLAADLKGLGDSAGGHPYDPVTCAHEFAAVIRAQAGGPVDVVGHDWGGLIAVALAAERADLVRRLVLVSAPYRTLDPLRVAYVPLLALPVLPGLALRIAGPLAVRAMIAAGWRRGRPDAAVLEHYQRAYRPGVLLGYYQDLVRPQLASWAQLVLRGSAARGRPALVRAPALVLCGSADPLLPVDVGQAAAQALAGRFVAVEGAGHWPLEEAPEEAVPPIVAFLS